MNAEKMTREEFITYVERMIHFRASELFAKESYDFWSRIDAIQSAPFVPDWSLKPEWADGFAGHWVKGNFAVVDRIGEFYLHAPSNPSDAELSAIWEKLDRDKRVQILRDAGVVV